MRRFQPHSRGLLLIAAFKLLKGFLLLAIGVGALELVHKDVAAELIRWIDIFRVDPDNIFIHRIFAKFSILSDRQLRELSFGTFFYSALLLTEGIGLALRKRWAEYFTIIVTTSFIPLEVWQIARRVSGPKVLVLLINVAIVAYLVMELRRTRGAAE
jgi:uncharacterized membrane protein (DUF2068 family)